MTKLSAFLLVVLSFSFAAGTSSITVSNTGTIVSAVYPNCGTPLLTNTNQLYTSAPNTNDTGMFASNTTGTFKIATFNKRSLNPPCSVNGVFEWITMKNVTVLSASPNTGDCIPSTNICDIDLDIQSQDHSNPKCQTVGSQPCYLHTEIDQQWQANYHTPINVTKGERINITGFAFWDWDGSQWWEIHPVASWSLS